MDFRFTDEQLMFRDAVRDFLDAECAPALLRSLFDAPDGGAVRFRTALAALGVNGMLIAEDQGGLGLGELDAVLVAEEFGRAAVPGALFDSIAVAAPLLAAASPALAQEWAPRVAAGEATIALADPLSTVVLDCGIADLFVMTDHGAVTAAQAAVVERTAAPSIDTSRRPARISCAAGDRIALADGPAAGALIDLARDRAALYVAADLVGATQRILDMAVDYAKQREQFGRPIGSFQAVKHLLADVQVRLTFARPVVYYAAYALAHGLPDRSLRASHAKIAATQAATLAARRCLQVHGAMGYTWEYDLQIWLKRIWANVASWGTVAWHKDRVAGAILAQGADLGPGRIWAA